MHSHAPSIDPAPLPGQLSRKLPRHPVPCALIVDAANDGAKRFYGKFGFAPPADDPMRLFLPLGHAAPRGPKG